MSCHTAPWLCAPTPTAISTTGSSKLYKSTTIFCCINTPADSSQPSSSVWTGSSSRRWYNPLKKRPLDQPPEIVRHWIDSDHPFPSPETFTVVSYNILGDRNAFKHRDLYYNVPFSYMKWDRRRRVICNEIIGWNPDIICLQEVDKYFDLLSIMEKEGYAGSYKQQWSCVQVNAHVIMYSFFSSKLVVCNSRDALETLLMAVLCSGKLRSFGY